MLRLKSFAQSSRSPEFFALLALILGVLSVAKPTAAQPLTMTAGLKFSPPTYRIHCWQPIHLEFLNRSSDAIEGSVFVSLAYPQAPAAMVLPASIPPHARVRTTMWAYFPPPSTAGQTRKDNTAPLGIAEFRGRNGARLTRAEIVGLPISDASVNGAADEDQYGEMVLMVGRREMIHDELYEATWPIQHVSDDTGIPMAVVNVERDRLPHEAAGLRSLKAIVLEAIDPESLDQAQRTAMLEYLQGGGIVIVAAPVDAVGRTGSWLEPHLPVRLIGSRMAAQIKTSPNDDSPPLKLRESLPIIEAVDAGGDVLLRDGDYVHVATKSVGLGKVVFTSFPINGLAENQPQIALLWEQLLALKRPQWEWKRTQLDSVRHDVLGTMIGQKVAPWSVAAGVAAGYLVLILIAQGLFLGPARPKAFAATVGIALLLSGALLLTGMTRTRDTSLQSARLAVLDISPTGGGWRQESVAFGGIDDPKMPLRAAREDVFVRPAMADSSNPPIVRQQPFAVEAAGTFTQRVERIWEASGPADPKQSIAAVASFGPGGLTLNVDNGMGQPLQSPLFVWQARALAMDDLPISTSHVTSFRTNALGDFTSASMVASDDAKRRGRIVRASLTPPKSMMSQPEPGNALPLLVGWISEDADKALVSPPDGKVQISKSMVMVRTPVRIEPAQPGAKLSVPAALVNMNMGRLPYELDKGESVATQQPGEWLISFGVPKEVGKVRPTRVVLDARVTLPAHVMTISKNQCVDGTPKINRTAAPVAEWRGQVGPQHLEFTCAPGDFDKDGRVWLLLDVRPPQGTPGAVAWQIQGLEVSIEADAVAPPEPISLEAPPSRVREQEVK